MTKKTAFRAGLLAGCLLLVPGFALAQQSPPSPPPPTPEQTFPAAARGQGLRLSPVYYLSRWAEDWSEGDDAADAFAPLKHIDLGPEAYLSLNGQLRARYNFVDGPGLRDTPDTGQSMLRGTLGADLQVGSRFRVYGELITGQVDARNLAITGTSQNDIDVLQLFAEVSGNDFGAEWNVRAGRQDFVDVSPVLFSRREALNIPLTHNGVRASAAWSNVRLTVFDLRPTELSTGAFDDRRGDTERFTGANLSFVLDSSRTRFVDPFIYRHVAENRRWGATVGEDRRETVGVRAWGSAGSWTYDWTVARQSGRYMDRPVQALGVFTRTEKALGAGGWQPRLTLRADYGSGGGAFGGGVLNSFTYGVGHSPYFADNNYVAPTNLFSLAPGLSLRPTRDLRVSMEWVQLVRADDRDAVYSGGGTPYPGTESVSGDDVGGIMRFSGALAIDRHLSVSTLVNVVSAGPVLERAGYGDSFYVALWTSFIF